jgi:hypothetical protein
MKRYMDGNVDPHYIGMKWVKISHRARNDTRHEGQDLYYSEKDADSPKPAKELRRQAPSSITIQCG